MLIIYIRCKKVNPLIFRKAILADVDQLSQLRVSMLNEEKKYKKEFNQTLFENTKQFLVNGMTNYNVVVFVAIKNEKIIATGYINFFHCHLMIGALPVKQHM